MRTARKRTSAGHVGRRSDRGFLGRIRVRAGTSAGAPVWRPRPLGQASPHDYATLLALAGKMAYSRSATLAGSTAFSINENQGSSISFCCM